MDWRRTIVLATSLLIVSSTATAQDNAADTEFVPDEIVKKESKKQGLDGTLQASATLNLVSNDKVVGQTDGLTTLVGVGIVGTLDWIKHQHEWKNSLKISEAFSRTPAIQQFLKSDDVVELESIYDYFLIKWAGLFVRLNLDTALFKSEAVTAVDTVYQISDVDGNVVDTRTTQRLPLSENLQPFTLRETLGVFAEPVQDPKFSLATRVGFGLRETWAQGVYVLSDDEDTGDVVEVKDITNPDSDLTIFQGGLEAFVGVSGALLQKRVTYDVGSTVLVPFINNDSQDRTAGELTRFGVAADVGLKVVDWLSINYKFRLLRDPQLIGDIQVQNNILLSLNYTFIDTAKVEETEPAPPSEPTEAEKAAVERAEAAEKRAEEAEAEAAKLREKLDTEPEPAPEPEPEPEP